VAKRNAQVDMLGAVDLFADLSRKEVGLVLQFTRELDFPAGKVVVREGDEGGRFFLIVSGTAVVTRRGRRIRTLGPGDSFGDIALLDGGPRSATVEAETPLSTLSLAVWHFRGALRENPSIALKLLLTLCRRLRDAETKLPI
jgi:CRP-like cAMP-binding protein